MGGIGRGTGCVAYAELISLGTLWDMRMRWTPVLALMACDAERLELPDDHFDPPSGYTFTEENPEVSIINLDNEATIVSPMIGQKWTGMVGLCESLV